MFDKNEVKIILTQFYNIFIFIFEIKKKDLSI